MLLRYKATLLGVGSTLFFLYKHHPGFTPGVEKERDLQELRTIVELTHPNFVPAKKNR